MASNLSNQSLVEIPEKQIPFGTPIPNLPHAVSCSFPTMRDVIRYEEGDACLGEILKVAYPRFVTHHRVIQWERILQLKFELEGKVVYCVCPTQAAKDMQQYLGFQNTSVIADEAYGIVAVANDEETVFRAKKYLQHTGFRISSRKAEDFLVEEGVIEGSPNQANPDAYEMLQASLTEKIGVRTKEDVFMAHSGMSAIYAAFRAIDEVQSKKGRTLWIQLGWMYVDTYEILNKFAGEDDRKIFIQDPMDLNVLEAILEERGDQVAGLISEMPTNPLVQTPDPERLLALTRKYGVALVVDPTVSSIVNVDTLPYCDVLVTSLTKYVSHEGDVMMGAVALQSESPLYEELKPHIAKFVEPPYSGDVARVAEQLDNIESIAKIVNANTVQLANFFEDHAGVKCVYWVGAPSNSDRYHKIEKDEGCTGGMITIDLVKPVAEFYDKCRIPKGPSFGMDRTLMSPFMYMAHYDIISSSTGRDQLLEYGLNPDLIRISVGTESIDQIIAAFDEAL